MLRRFDCILAPTKAAVLKQHASIKSKGENIIRHRLSQITGVPFFNLSKFTIAKPAQSSGLNGLLDDPNQLAPNLSQRGSIELHFVAQVAEVRLAALVTLSGELKVTLR